jgi:pimeloyl-ACP methyl ester carboxylesterase
MGETERAYAPGNFVALSKGLVHYRWFGEKHNDLVVCVHGLTTPSFVFESLAEYYVKTDKCVLVFDNYGRGYSDRPKGKQDKEFFINQLDELLDKLDLNKD